MNTRFASRVVVAAAMWCAFSVRAHAQTHFWNFNDGTLTDVVGGAIGSLDGATVSGGVLHTGIGMFAQFDDALIPTSGPYSISLFARAVAGANTDYAHFISQGQINGGIYIGLDGDGGPDMRAGDDWQDAGGAQFIADGSFHNYTLTVDGTFASFYVDGVLDPEGTVGAFWANDGTPTRFGEQFDNPFGTQEFVGDLDDIGIYDTALTGAQVGAISAEGPVSTPEPSTLALFGTGLAGVLFVRRRRSA